MLLFHTSCYIKKRTSRRFERAFLFSSETSGPSPPFGLGLYCSDSFATISLMCGSLIEAIISPSCIPSIGLTLVFSLVPVEPWIPIQTYYENIHHEIRFQKFKNISSISFPPDVLPISNLRMSGRICDCGSTIIANSPRLP